MTTVSPEEKPASFARVFELEAEYQAIEHEYKVRMRRLKHSCVGKDKAAAECVQAAQLNADMQTTLAALSETLKKTKPAPKTSVVAQQFKLLGLADDLEAEYTTLTADQADRAVKTTMYRTHYLAWALGLGLLVLLLMRRQ